jgi:hypothetical protein
METIFPEWDATKYVATKYVKDAHVDPERRLLLSMDRATGKVIVGQLDADGRFRLIAEGRGVRLIRDRD